MSDDLLPADTLWYGSRKSRPEAVLLEVDPEQSPTVAELYGLVRNQLGANAQLYISGYEQDLARWVPSDATPEKLQGTLAFYGSVFDQLPDTHKNPDYIDGRRTIFNRKYPAGPARPHYFWAVASEIHAIAGGGFGV